MPMMPKRVKFRKSQKGRVRGNATRGNYVAFGVRPSSLSADHSRRHPGSRGRSRSQSVGGGSLIRVFLTRA